jgi:hypothetical protein
MMNFLGASCINMGTIQAQGLESIPNILSFVTKKFIIYHSVQGLKWIRFLGFHAGDVCGVGATGWVGIGLPHRNPGHHGSSGGVLWKMFVE